jgi:large conductance mechanosensitive channel
MKGFMDFLRKYGIIGLAIAVVIGGKLNDFIGSLVNDLLMPAIFSPLLKTAHVDEIAKLHTEGGIYYGKVLGAGINFLVVAFIIYLFARRVLREEVVEKK